MSRRTEMLASTIRQELAMIIMREISDPRIRFMPSITRVKVSEDISYADIYITTMGTPGEQTAALNALRHSAGMMRQKLGRVLEIRQIPYLRFHYDEAQKKELEMLELLHRIELERRDREAPDAGEVVEDEQEDSSSDLSAEGENKSNEPPPTSTP